VAKKKKNKKSKTGKGIVRRPQALGKTEKHNWTAARQWYMLANLNRADDEPEVTLKVAAKMCNIPLNTLYERAKKQGWRQQMQMARDAQDDMGMKKVVKFTGLNQAQTRAEFAEGGLIMARKARLRIAMQDPTDIPLGEANSMLQRAQQIVGKAQGWPEKFIFDSSEEGEYETAAKRISDHAGIERLAAQFLEFMVKRRKDREEAIDVTPEPANG